MSRPAPPLVLSLGDPAGVGPEIAAKAWRTLRATGLGPVFVVVGDAGVLRAAAGEVPVRGVADMAEGAAAFAEALPVIDSPVAEPVTPGRPSSANAAAVVRWIETGTALALSGKAGGLVTCPIAKATLYEAGFAYPGHTEFVAALTEGAPYPGPRGPVMMLTAADLRTVLVTIHAPLAKAIAALTADAIVKVGRVTAFALQRDFGIERPRLALAGLNPHAGEGGAIGREEIEIVAPAARRLREAGIDCTDPRPADTLFHAEARGGYDAAVCLYHDQALIPVKTLDFWGGVNATLGLPIVRTSPDHGTGFDLAGQGVAREDSLVAALRLAAEMAERRRARGRAGV